MTSLSLHPDFEWQWRDREARLLADLLRTSRMTILHGEAGTGKTTLLATCVLPLLRRRVGDHSLTGTWESRVVVPFPDRRSGEPTSEDGPEVAVYFDAWDSFPVQALTARILAALRPGLARAAPPEGSLVQNLAAWNRKLGVRFLLLLDRFDAYLAAPAHDPGIRDFEQQFVAAVMDPMLRANFLVSLRDLDPLLERFRRGIPHIGDSCLRLPAPHRAPHPPPLPARELDFPDAGGCADAASGYDGSVEAERHDERLGPESPSQRAEEPQPVPPPPGAIRPADGKPGRRLSEGWKLLALGAAAAVLLLIVPTLLDRAAQEGRGRGHNQFARKADLPVPAGKASPAPAPAAASAPVSPLPKVRLLLDASSDTDRRIAADLARFVAPDAGIQLVAEANSVAVGTADSRPQFAIVHYDALEAARAVAPAAVRASGSLRIVTPLYIQEMHFIVRGDSPLNFVHQLRGARINFGPARSSRALTATLLYSRLFGASIPQEYSTFLGDREALAALLIDRSIDAMVVIAAQPIEWFAELPADAARSIKLLKLDRNHPASRRAAETYLPAVVRTSSYGGRLAADVPTLAVMSFLVTSEYTDSDSLQRLESFARSLCRNLPALQREGHPKWREVQPGLQLEVGWPYSAPAQAAFRSCRTEPGTGKSAASGSRR